MLNYVGIKDNLFEILGMHKNTHSNEKSVNFGINILNIEKKLCLSDFFNVHQDRPLINMNDGGALLVGAEVMNLHS